MENFDLNKYIDEIEENEEMQDTSDIIEGVKQSLEEFLEGK